MRKNKTVEDVCRRFQKDIQRLVDKSKNITSISMTVGDKTVTIAEKKTEESEAPQCKP